MKKRVLSIFLAVCMVFTLLPTSAFAATTASGTCGDNLTWTLKDGTLTISGTGDMADFGYSEATPWENYSSSVKSVVIKDGVTNIGMRAFECCSNLTSVTIPDGVTSIGIRAFEGCTRLTKVKIPDSVTSIESGAFSSCSSMTSATIGNSVATIGNGVFFSCRGLKSVTIPDSVTSIGEYSFSNCSGLTSVKIGNSVTNIGKQAFESCSGLNSVTIPDSVTSIGEHAFNKCSKLTEVVVGENNSTYSSGNGVLFNKRKTELLMYPVGKTEASYTIPNGVTTIGRLAFEYSSNLTGVTIPNSIKSIGGHAFINCSSLTNVTIPNSVTSIGAYAFENCSNLKNAAIGNGVESIGEWAFFGCENLASIAIPDKVTQIKECTFYCCKGLTDVTIGNGVKSIGSHAFASCSSLTNVTLSESVTSIEERAFFGCSILANVTIPGSVASIGEDAFQNCRELARIDVEKDNAFYCSADGILFNKEKTTLINYPVKRAASAYTIPNGVVNIGVRTFSGCEKLTGITIPDSVTSIGEEAFSSCSNLTSVTIPNGVTSVGDSVFYNCSKLKNVTIPNTVTKFGAGMFMCCSSLTSITLPDSIKSIGNCTFEKCISLTNITIPKSVTRIYDGAFSKCSSLTSITIPDSVKNIGSCAFSKCSGLTSVTIPDSVKSIGDSAFGDCSNLEDVAIGNGLERIAWATFIRCTNLKSVTIPDSVKSIGYIAFSGCSNLKTVKLGSEITDIGESAFKNCSKLAKITIPKKVTTIGESAFEGCLGLKSVSIPTSVTTIGESAFNGCGLIGSVYYAGSAPQWKLIDIAANNDPLTKGLIQYNSYGFGDIGYNSSLRSEERITVIPQYDYEALSGVTAKYAGKSETNDELNAAFNFTRYGSFTTVTLTKAGFNDYIIPGEVMSGIKGGTGLDAYMQKSKGDGKPYISCVFGKISDAEEYIDLVNSPLVADKGSTYDIIMSASGLSDSVTYVIYQDDKHKIESSTGKFDKRNLYSVLDPCMAVYAYAKGSNGETAHVKLKVTRPTYGDALEQILNTSTFSLGGSGGMSIKIPDYNPLFGNSSISLEAFSAPLTVYYDTTNDTYIVTIGFDLYAYEKKDKTVYYEKGGKYKKIGDGETKKAIQNFKESFSYFNNKPFAEDKKDKNGDSYKKQWESFVKECKKCSSKDTVTKSHSFTTDFLGYFEFGFTDKGFTVKEGSVKVGAEYTYAYTYQGAIWVIPVYFKTTMGCAASLEGAVYRTTLDKALPFDFDINLGVEPEVSLEGGVGVEKLVKAGIQAKGSAPLLIEFTKNHFKLDFHGEINITTKAFIFKWDKTLAEGDLNVFDTYWGSGSKKAKAMLKSNGAAAAQDAGTESFVSRAYMSNTSAWLGGKSTPTVMKARSVSTDAVSVSTLQKSVFDNGKPVITTVGDKMLMAWIEDDASRDEYNRMRLVYSVYDGTNWSEPKAVYDDGKNDDAPAIVSDGNKVYFAWQKMTETLDSTATAAKAFQTVDTYTAEYDISTDTVSNVKRIDTDGYDYAQAITVVDHSPVVYFANCADESVAISQNSKIYKASGDAKDIIVEASPYVNTITANGSSMSYVADTDNDLDTFEDVNVLSYENGSFVPFEKPDETVAMTSAYYGKLNGQDTLFATDGANIYYYDNGELKTVFADSHRLSNLSILSDDESCMFVWSEMQDNTETMYGVKYADGSWSEPFTVSECDGFWVDHLSIAAYNGKIAGVFMQDIPDTTGELVKITQANLAFMTAADYYDIALDSLTADEENIIPGETAGVLVYVSNNSSQSVNAVEFTLSDSIGSDQTQTVNVDLRAGEAKNVTLTYTVPEDFKSTTLSVSAQISGKTETNTDDNSTTLKIGVADLRVLKSDVAVCDDNYIVTAYVKNNSQTTSGTVTANLYLDSEGSTIAAISEIGAIASDEVGMVQFVVPSSTLTFDEDNAARMYIGFADEESKYGSTAKECVLISKAETTCAHSMTEDVKAIAANCTEKGQTAGTKCLGCGEIVSGCEETPALGHDYDEWTVTTQPTCTAAGIETRTCTRCNASETRDINALGHDIKHHAAKTATCTEKGWAAYDTCSRCDYSTYKEIPATGHNYNAVVTAPTCTVKGYTTYTCSECGDSYIDNYIDALGHDRIHHEAKAATCTEKGWAAYDTCSRCDYSTYKEIPATGHHHNAVVTAPTCTAKGYTTHTCACGDSYIDNYIDALGHNTVHHDAKAATCTEKGWAAYDTCSRCNYSTYKEIAATGHHHNAVVTAPTCTAQGYTTHTCTACGNSYKDSYTNALGHNYATGKCTRCGAADPSFNPAPAAPELKITTSAGKPKISWDAVDGAVKYWVYRSTDGKTFKYYDSTTKTTYTNNSTTIGTTYYYKVKAVNVVEGKNYTSAYSVSKGIQCKPAAPTVSINRSNGKPKLSWKAVSGATKYWIYRSTDGVNFKYWDSTTKTSYTNSGAASGTKYYYRVKAVAVVNGKNIVSANSSTKSLFTSLAKPSVSITTSNGKPKLTWKAVTGADKYYIYRSTDGKNFSYWDSTTKTTYVNSGAKKNTKYYYKVKAVCASNSNANSTQSSTVSIKATK